MNNAWVRTSMLIAAMLATDAPAWAQTAPAPPVKVPITVNSDRVDDGAVVQFDGNVAAQFDGNTISSDQASYDKSGRSLTATGHVVVRETNGNIIRASRYTLPSVDVVPLKR
jgi:lipopolysaccharide assembly outer membrane protein LptD (OstA)